MRMVVTGSTAIENSSRRRSSGSWDSARAIVRRCCCPPESRLPSESNRSLTSSHSAARRRHRSTTSSSRAFLRIPRRRGENATFSYTVSGSPTGSGNTTPIRLLSAYSLRQSLTFFPLMRTLPATSMAALKASIRLSARRNDVLPLLAGPIMPKISCR